MAGFQVYSAEEDGGGIDFEALNQYVVEEANLRDGETLIGYVSNIVDLGTQKLPDGEYKVDKEDEDLTIGELTDKYAAEIAEGKITKFDLAWENDVKAKIIKKFVPQRDRQSVTFSVDFPEIMLDKATFFGQESDPKPLRLWMGGEFWDAENKQMVVNSVIALKKTKDEKLGWTMNPRSTLYKMAVASKVITKDQPFQPEMIDELLGKSLQFNAQIFFKENKGKEYYNENLKFVGGLARGQKEIEEVETHLIQFNTENDETALKDLRKHIINTMALATNFEGSKVQEQLIALGKYKADAKPDAGTDEDEEGESSEVETDDGFGFE